MSGRRAGGTLIVMNAADMPLDGPSFAHEMRRYYFALNWVRGIATWAAFGLFAAAAYSAWS